MAVFTFEAKNQQGQLIKGELDVSSEAEARMRLRSQKLTPVKVSVKGLRKITYLETILQPSVKPKELQVFTRQFSTLINSGIPIVQALEILNQGIKSPMFHDAVDKVRKDISAGLRLADAMGRYPKVFDRLYVNLVKAGEEGGVLDVILNRLALYIEKSSKIKNKIMGALWYPAGIISVAVIVIWVILTFVIPKFEKLFASSGQQLPALTQMVINLSHFLGSYWWAFILVIGGSVYGIRQFYLTETGRYEMDALALRIPIVGPLIQKAGVARFTRTMSTLLSSGVSILDALDIASKVVGNAVLEKTLITSRESISRGRSIVEPLSKDKNIPEMVVQMIGVGEQSGALDIMLGKIADFYEDEVDYGVTAMTSMIEPLLMVVLGGIVAFLVIAMYLPVFQLAGAAGG